MAPDMLLGLPVNHACLCLYVQHPQVCLGMCIIRIGMHED